MNISDKQGATPITLAASRRNADLIGLLVSNGAKLPDTATTPPVAPTEAAADKK